MDRVGLGDEHAYQILVQRHLNPCLGMVQRLVGDRQDAEDIMQEAFVRLWRFAPRWKASGARFTTWYYRVIMNLCINAADAMGRNKGDLIIRSEERELREVERQVIEQPEKNATSYVVIQVEDSGPGIPDDILATTIQ